MKRHGVMRIHVKSTLNSPWCPLTSTHPWNFHGNDHSKNINSTSFNHHVFHETTYFFTRNHHFSHVFLSPLTVPPWPPSVVRRSCSSVDCPANSEGANVPAGCTCEAGYSGSIEASGAGGFGDGFLKVLGMDLGWSIIGFGLPG